MEILNVFEIRAIGWAALLTLVQLLVMAVIANMQVSTAWLAGPRDEEREMPVLVGRMRRAQANMFEALAMFVPACLVVALTGAASGFTAACAGAFLAARVAYVPCYAFGIPWLRTVVWAVGFFATLLMLLAALF